MKALVKFVPMLLTATIAVGLKLIVESKRKRITFWSASLSWFAAVGICYIVYPVALKYIDEAFIPMTLAFVVLVGDKITTYVVEKFHVDDFMTAASNYALEKLKTIFK